MTNDLPPADEPVPATQNSPAGLDREAGQVESAGRTHRADLRAWGRWIRVLRTARGLTQEQLGQAADIDKSTISSIERGGKNVGVAYVWPLARALGVRPSDLFRVEDAGVEDRLRQLLGD